MLLTAQGQVVGDPAMSLFEMLALGALLLVVLAISGWLDQLLGVPPWSFALPIVVLGLRRLLLGSWSAVAAALAVGASLALFTRTPWSMAVLAGGATLYALCWLRAWTLTRRDPAGLYLHLGQVLVGRRHYDAAVQEYTQALAARPNDPAGVHLRRGLALQHMEDYGRAMADYGRALRLSPKLGAAYYHKAVAHERLGQPRAALAAYEKFITAAARNDPHLERARERIRQLRAK